MISTYRDKLTPDFSKKMPETISSNSIEFVGASYDTEWSIDNFDPDEVARIKRIYEAAKIKMDGFLPNKIELHNLDDLYDGIAVSSSEDISFIDINVIEKWEEDCFEGILAHEACHTRYKDSLVGDSLSRVLKISCGVKEIHNIFEENPAAFSGILINKFGSLDQFAFEMQNAMNKTNEFLLLIKDAGLSNKTDPMEFTDRLLTNPEIQKKLSKVGHVFPECDFSKDPVYSMCQNFNGNSIESQVKAVSVAAKINGELLDDYINDHVIKYESFLPEKEEDKNLIINQATKIYHDFVAPTYLAYEELGVIEEIIHHAFEHRADAVMAEAYGVETSLKVLSKILEHENNLSESEKQELELQKDTHPNVEKRIAFVRERYGSNTLTSTRKLQGNKIDLTYPAQTQEQQIAVMQNPNVKQPEVIKF